MLKGLNDINDINDLVIPKPEDDIIPDIDSPLMQDSPNDDDVVNPANQELYDMIEEEEINFEKILSGEEATYSDLKDTLKELKKEIKTLNDQGNYSAA